MLPEPEAQFEISEEKVNLDYIRLNIKGVVDVHTSPKLRKALDRCFAGNPKCMHVVLDAVPRMDSSGVATLLEGLRWSRSSGNRFVLSGLNGALQDLFVISNLEQEFEIMVGDQPVGVEQ